MEKLRQLVNTAQSTADGRANIIVGSYIGDGTYGVSGPCSITCPFEPKLIGICDYIGNVINTAGHEFTASSYTQDYAFGTTSNLSTEYGKGPITSHMSGSQSYSIEITMKLSPDHRTVYWQATRLGSAEITDGDKVACAKAQLNISGALYRWFAIG